MEPAERAQLANERRIKNWERLRTRVLEEVRGVAKRSALFQAHPELGEPDVIVTVYAQFVDINTSLNKGQLDLLPVTGRARDLVQYAEELRAGLEKIAADIRLPMVTEPGGPYGHSQHIMLIDFPSGYRAVFSRPES